MASPSLHKVYIVCGSPASGKSTYGIRLARDTGAAFLDMDTVSERIVQKALHLIGYSPDDRDSPFYKENFRDPIYETLFDIAAENRLLRPVVLVGPFTKEMRLPPWPAQLSRRVGGPVEVHYIWCAPEIRRQRMIRRANPRDRSKLAHWDSHMAYYEGETRPLFPHVFVDNTAERHTPHEEATLI